MADKKKKKSKENVKEGVQYAKMIVIYGELEEVMIEQLARSITGETTYLINIDVMVERLFRDCHLSLKLDKWVHMKQ